MLATAGVVFQGLLRNPLATPFTLGVSAGAALGAMLAITFGWSFAWAGIPAAPAASFIGSLGAVGIVYALARARHRRHVDQRAAARRRDDERVLLGADPVRPVLRGFAQTYRMLRWLMGDLDVSGYQPVLDRAAAGARVVRRLRLAGAAAQPAQPWCRERGDARLDVVGAQRAAFISASLATGAAVSVGGPVGFIGIIVPHLVRS